MFSNVQNLVRTGGGKMGAGMRRPAVLAGAALVVAVGYPAVGVAGERGATAVPTAGASPSPAPGNPYGDPHLVSMFDGATLDGWVQAKPGQFVVRDGAIHSTGTARGWIHHRRSEEHTSE